MPGEDCGQISKVTTDVECLLFGGGAKNISEIFHLQPRMAGYKVAKHSLNKAIAHHH